MTAFDTAVEQKSDPVFQVLDAAFAQVQLEQKSLTRRYMAITQVRGLASGLVRDGLAVALHVDGDDLVVRVTVPGLSGVDAVVPSDAAVAGGTELAQSLDALRAEFEAMTDAWAAPITVRLDGRAAATEDASLDLAFDSRAEDEAWCAELAAADHMAALTEVEISGALSPDEVQQMADEIQPLGVVSLAHLSGHVVDVTCVVTQDQAEGVAASASALAALIAAQEAVEPVSAPAPVSPPASVPAFKSHWTDAEDDALIDATWEKMNAGMMQGQAISAASEAMNRTARAGLERVRRHLQPRLDAKLAANPIDASGRIAAAVQSDGRGQHGGWPDMWSPEDEAQLVSLVADGVCAGKSKSLSLDAAAATMGRSKKGCQNRLYNRLADALQAEVERRKGPGFVVTSPERKVCGGKVIGWTPAEDARMVGIVADAICAGQTKWTGIAAAAQALGRPESGVQFRILNKAKDDLAAELARRAAGSDPKPTNAAAAPAPAPIVLPPVSLPEAVQVVRGGGAAPSTPAAPLPSPAPVAAKVTPAPLPPAVKESLTVAPAPERRAPTPAIVADARPPRPAAGERASQVAPPDDLAPVLAHLRTLTKGDAKALKADFAIMHLACAGFKMGDIATDLGLDSKHVKQRFEALCGYEGGKGRFLRSHVYEAIEHLLTPAAVVA